MLGAGVVAFAGVETRHGGALAFVRNALIGHAVSTAAFDITGPINCTSGNLLVVTIEANTSQNSFNPNVVTFNGTSMTLLALATDSTYENVWIYYLQNPAQMTANVEVKETSGSIYANQISVTAYVISGANSSTPFQTIASNFGSTSGASASVTTTGAVLLVGVSGVAFPAGSSSYSAGFTLDQSYIDTSAEHLSLSKLVSASATTALAVTPNPTYAHTVVLLAAVQG
jgi:hypothetical protein